jgi:hypothetical protein
VTLRININMSLDAFKFVKIMVIFFENDQFKSEYEKLVSVYNLLKVRRLLRSIRVQ